MFDVLGDALVLACVYVLVATGLTMVYGVLKVLHVAHGVVYATGAFVGYLAYQRTGSLLAAGLAAGAFAGALGVLIYHGVYRRTVRVSPGVTLIASVGLLVMIEDLLRKPYLVGPYRLPFRAQVPLPTVELGPLFFTGEQLLILAVAVPAVLFLYALIHRHPLGLAWHLITFDPSLAGSLGIRVEQAIALNFFVGSFLAGLAGTLIGVYNHGVWATMGGIPAYKAFVVLVLGGLGSVKGAAVAALLLAVTETLIAFRWGFVIPRDAVAFLVMIAVLLLRPEGLFR